MTATTHAASDALVDPAGQIRRLTERATRLEEALDRWCHYQDRIREVLGRERHAALRAALTEGGWVNESRCPHRVGSEMLPLIVGNARLAKCEHVVEFPDATATACQGFLFVHFGAHQGQCTTCRSWTGFKVANYVEVVPR